MAFPGDYTLLGKKTLPTITGMHFDFVQLLKYDDFDYTYVGGETLTGNLLDYLDDGGGDLRFSSDSAGTNQLACEVVQLDKVGNSIQVWVKIPFAFTGIEVFIWGDNTGDSQPAVTDTYGRNAVWSNFFYVSHDGVTDSTGTHTITLFGSPSSAPDPFGGSNAIDLNGSSQYGRAAVSYVRSRPMTYQVWANPDVLSGANIGILGSYSSSEAFRFDSLKLSPSDDFGFFDRVNNNTEVLSSVSVSTSNWYKVTTIANSSSSRSIIVDGSTKNTDTTSNPSFTATMNRLTFGRFDDSSPGAYFNGQLAEMRVLFGAVSDDLELTEYQNQSSVGEWGVTSGIAGGGGIVIEGQTALYDYQGVSGSIDLTGEITVTGQTASYFYTGVAGEVELTSALTVTGQTANYDYVAINGEIELVGSLIVEGQTANYDYNAIQAEVILQGEVIVTGATASYNYEAISGVVNVFETWAIKQPVNSSWTIQQETQTNWSKK